MTDSSTETPNHPDENGQSISLPVIDSTQSGHRGKAPMMGRTKRARWRAAVLITVNVLMIAHLIQWLVVGMTISPIEPSETMETLEVGVVNAGAIFFLAAILSTIVFGRFFCGWLCHIVALQDLCAYIMTSIGIRPKPFRSRLLVYFPFLLGMYMFVWPSFKRLALAPVLKSAAIGWPAWLRPVEPIHQWSTGLVINDFWATMPPWSIAVPFLLLCGFAAVYFLGAKGFCTYGCPYAAFFKPIDKIAPVRIRVNDDCHQCGYCTSVCTSNVRVSEEVRDFGMVVDNGCMKTLDCISACPNDALSLGLGKIALGAKPRSPETYIQAKAKRARRFDMKMGEELFASVLFLWFFFATRGMLDAVPMLMAGGLAAIGVMVVMTSIKLLRIANLRLYGFTLKSKGRIKPPGIALVLLALGFALGSAWSGQARAMRWYGDVLFAKSEVPTSVLLRAEYQPSPEQRARANHAVRAYKRGDSFDRAGLGWTLDAEHRIRLSYFLSMLGRYDEALDELMIAIEDGNPSDQLVLQAGQLSTKAIEANPPDDAAPGTMQGVKRDRLLEIYRQALAAHPNLHAIRTELSRNAYSIGETDKADALFDIHDFDDDPSFLLAKANYLGFAGQMVETRSTLKEAAEKALKLDRPAGMLVNIAMAALQYRMTDLALDLALQAIDTKSATTQTWLGAGEIANAAGNPALGKERALHALTMPGADRPLVQARAGGVLAQPGDTDRARALLIDAAQRAHDPFDAVYIAQGMIRGGTALGDEQMLERGIGLLGEVAQSHPDLYVIRHDYASMLYAVGRTDEAIEQLTIAAQLDATNPVLASRLAELYQLTGDEENQHKWEQEAEKRSHAHGA